MEFMAEFTEGMSRDRALQIIKGKRTKRQRPCSPLGTSTTSGNTSGNSDCLIDEFTPEHSPALSSEVSTKEDEDMANCLILLAQSEPEAEYSDQIRRRTEKLTGRRLPEMTSGDYECKTCNRRFPSFQALGGHRASHKKPNVNVDEKRSGSGNNIIPPPLMEHVEEHEDADEDEEDHQHQHKVVVDDEEIKANVITSNNNIHKSPSRSSSTFVQTGIIITHNIRSKVHECSICGSEFLSGQALGGHMRKHRPIPATGNRTVTSANTDDIGGKSPAGGSSMLSLDLNFPPPEAVEDHRQSKFQFTGSSSQQQQRQQQQRQQQHLVFSPPAFVDCHY